MYLRERQAAIDLVSKACRLADEMQSTLVEEDCFFKEDLSPVTIVDITLQTLINCFLMQHFPDDPIMGEEDSYFVRKNPRLLELIVKKVKTEFPELTEDQVLYVLDHGKYKGGSQKRFWTIDPIDGTKGFIRKEQYVVAVALIEEGKVVLGVLGCPRLVLGKKRGAIFYATRDEKTHLKYLETGITEEVPTKNLSKLQLLYCEPHSSSRSHSHEQAEAIAKLLDAHPKAHRLDSQCKYTMVALQAASIYLRVPKTGGKGVEKIWDHAAGSIIVEQAGGTVTDLKGLPLNFSLGTNLLENWGILATNGIDHNKVVDAAHQIL